MSQLSQSAVAVSVHDDQPSDHPGIRAVLQAAYREYATVLPPGSSTSTALPSEHASRQLAAAGRSVGAVRAKS
jgi:hypothetical protein